MNHSPPTIPVTATDIHWALTSHGPADTIALGQRIGEAIQSNLFIALSGDLGAGKTTFTAGLTAGLGIPAFVTSPTFTLINDYARGQGSQARRLVHMDVYRLEGGSAAELDGIGFGDLVDDLDAPDALDAYGLLVLVVEWADRLGRLLPDERLDVTSVQNAENPDQRLFTLVARGENATALLQRLMKE